MSQGKVLAVLLIAAAATSVSAQPRTPMPNCCSATCRSALHAVGDNVVWNADQDRRIAGVALLRGPAPAVSRTEEHQ